mmetsp:Transcript_34381/g.33584  ORF Transcript_34381/g.33584 Transcript_34381/m.33584 type:complete len:92 (+) Transcript_34381:277-552(+)
MAFLELHWKEILNRNLGSFLNLRVQVENNSQRLIRFHWRLLQRKKVKRKVNQESSNIIRRHTLVRHSLKELVFHDFDKSHLVRESQLLKPT